MTNPNDNNKKSNDLAFKASPHNDDEDINKGDILLLSRNSKRFSIKMREYVVRVPKQEL